MRYVDVVASFFRIFPNYQEKVTQWSPNGRNGVKFKLNNGVTMEFTYSNDNEWTLSSTTTKNRRV